MESYRRTLTTTLLAIVATALIVNLLSFIVIYTQYGQNSFSRTAMLSFKQRFIMNETSCFYPHPFFGENQCTFEPSENRMNSGEPLYFSRGSVGVKDVVRVLILGGSVAAHLSKNTTDEPAQAFKGIQITNTDIFANILNAKLKTDRYSVWNAAFGGSKQPQQLFKLYYLLLLGEKFDIVINLDGFNEVALSLSENKHLALPPIYPRSFSRLVHASGSLDISCVPEANELAKRYSWLPALELYHLYKTTRCYHLINRTFENDASSNVAKLSNFAFVNDERLFESVADIWRRSSAEIELVAQARGFDYIHVVQPNQYVSNSKILSAVERRDFVHDPLYGPPAKRFYSLLAFDGGQRPQHYLDLRYLFETNSDTLYRDFCCHLTNKGMAYIAEAIVDRNLEIFRRRLNRH